METTKKIIPASSETSSTTSCFVSKMVHHENVLQAILSNHLGEPIDRLKYESIFVFRKPGEKSSPLEKLKVECHVPRNMQGESGTYVMEVTVKDGTYSSCQMIDWKKD